jgi:predicted transcriptional regulator
VPGLPKMELSAKDRRRLHALNARMEQAEADLEQVRQEWAKFVRAVGQAPVAREMDLTPQAVGDRIRNIERRR